MSRYKALKERTSNDRIELLRITENPLSDPSLVIRSKAILMFLDGKKGDAIASTLKVRPNTVSAWRKRYEENGVNGLYDLTAKGKRSSATRKKVLEVLNEEPPEGTWSTKKLAEVVGTSEDTVRRALKDEHLSLSTAYVWDKETKRSLPRIVVDPVGLYLAKEEIGFVLQVDSEPDKSIQELSLVTTGNRSLARSLSVLEERENGLSLEEALVASVEQMKNVTRGENVTFQAFLKRLFTKRTKAKSGSTMYYVYYWYSRDAILKPILQETGVIVQVAETVQCWFDMIQPWITILSEKSMADTKSDTSNLLLSSITLYLEKTNTEVEPFAWSRISA